MNVSTICVIIIININNNQQQQSLPHLTILLCDVSNNVYVYIQSVLYEIIVVPENQHLSHTLHNDFNLNYDIIGHAYSIKYVYINSIDNY